MWIWLRNYQLNINFVFTIRKRNVPPHASETNTFSVVTAVISIFRSLMALYTIQFFIGNPNVDSYSRTRIQSRCLLPTICFHFYLTRTCLLFRFFLRLHFIWGEFFFHQIHWFLKVFHSNSFPLLLELCLCIRTRHSTTQQGRYQQLSLAIVLIYYYEEL